MPDAPLALVAGAGRLPLLVAESLARQGRTFRVLALRGFAPRRLAARADAVVGLLDVEAALASLDAWRPGGVVLAGAVARPGPGALLGAAVLLRDPAAREAARAALGGDDRLLRRVVALIEARGHPVLAVDAVAPDLLAPVGPIARGPVPAREEPALAVGRAVLAALSPFDVGQAVVVEGERVLAVEGPEGTDRMLARARPWRVLRSRGAARRGGVLVKLAKAGQDRRVDLPTIGPRTVRRAAAAGLSGIAVGAGTTLVIDRAETAALADGLGLFLIGLGEEGE